MKALHEFASWLSGYTHTDTNCRLPIGLRLNIHSRSDAHSVRLANCIVDELLDICPVLRDQAARGRVGYGVNYQFRWPNGKLKTLDLVVGIPLVPREPPNDTRIHRLRSRGARRREISSSEQFSRLLIACELKSVLTEHTKSQPRVFDELNGSHAIAHAGSRDTIAAGITLINIASSFVSPLRQSATQPVVVTQHHQPTDAANMVAHLRGLPRRTDDNPVGFDAYCSFVMDVNNQGLVALWTAQPAPQPGEPDHFDGFLADICRAYTQQFGDLEHLPDPVGLSIEEVLRALSRRYPGLLDETGKLAVNANLDGAPELHAILRAIDAQTRADIAG